MLFLLDPNDPRTFPDPERAEKEPDGLLAVGGDLQPERLLNAYSRGIFPWYSDDQPILWWSPDPRTVLYPEQLHLSRSLRKAMRKCGYHVVFDRAFAEVIDACAAPRSNGDSSESGTWITEEMRTAYIKLHQMGHAHSVEVMQEDKLVGGLYGVSLGQVFFGESMFSRVSNGSKIALAALVYLVNQWNCRLVDCQVYTDHLISLGAEEISRRQFSDHLAQWCPVAGNDTLWSNFPALEANELV